MRLKTGTLTGSGMVFLLSLARLAGAGDTRLADAVMNQNKEAARALLKQRVDVNAPQGGGSTALHWAAHWNDLATADLLIASGANVNAATDLGVTPVYLAAEIGSGAIVTKLLAAGANPNAAFSAGITPLMLAARAGSVEAVRAMLAHQANVNAKENVRGQTALMWAAAQGHPDVVRMLTELGADVHGRTLSSKMYLNRGNFNGTNGSWVESGGSTALLFAARNGDVESARILIESGANVNDTAADGNSALVLAAHSGHGPLATILLDKGADPKADGAGYTVLHAAVLRGDLNLVKASLARGANPNAQYTQGTPVIRQSHDFFLLASLVGATPLVLAAQYGSVDMIRALVANGADIRLATKDGTTPLLAGANADHHQRQAIKTRLPGDERQEAESLETVKVLLELGADINETNHAGNTALHIATALRSNTVIQFLAEKGAQLDVKNKSGQTALALASGGGRGRGAGNASQPNSTADLLRRLGAK